LHSGIFATIAQKAPFVADLRMIEGRLRVRLIPDLINGFSERGSHARFSLEGNRGFGTGCYGCDFDSICG
jgi:hypothetical protein